MLRHTEELIAQGSPYKTLLGASDVFKKDIYNHRYEKTPYELLVRAEELFKKLEEKIKETQDKCNLSAEYQANNIYLNIDLENFEVVRRKMKNVFAILDRYREPKYSAPNVDLESSEDLKVEKAFKLSKGLELSEEEMKSYIYEIMRILQRNSRKIAKFLSFTINQDENIVDLVGKIRVSLGKFEFDEEDLAYNFKYYVQ